MFGQPHIIEKLNDYRQDDLYIAAKESRTSTARRTRSAIGRAWNWVIALVRMEEAIVPSVTASSARMAGR